MKQVVIIGGGILGLACAYYLQRSGQAQVTLLEAGDFASATTSQAAALLTRARNDINASRYVAETHHIIAQFEQQLGQTLMQRPGCWHLVDGDVPLTTLQHYQQLAQPDNAPQWRQADALRAALPAFEVGDDARALVYHNDGFIDPYLLATTYLQQARALGAVCLSQRRVTRLQSDNNRITAVLTERQSFSCDALLLAAGPWSKVLARQLDSPLAMATVRSHYWITDPQPLVARAMPMLIDQRNGFYFRSENGALLFGLRDSQGCVTDATQLPDDIHSLAFPQDPQGWAALEENWQALIARCPLLAQAQLNHYIAGVSSYTPDGKPLLGPLPGWCNAFVASGCSGAGIAWSGGIGRAVADCVLGQQGALEIACYAPERFARHNPQLDVFSAAFQQQCALARSQKKTG